MKRNKKGQYAKGHEVSYMPPRSIKKCSIKGCARKHGAKGYCKKHYLRYYLYGDPLAVRQYKQQKIGEYFNCLLCDKKFYRPPSAIKKGENKYCSKECGYKDKRGVLKNIKPLEEKTWRITRRGYLSTTVRRKRILQHRWFMEKHIGRPLRPDEKVHHINGVKTDNRISNLVIVGDSEHSKTYKQLLKDNAQLRALLAKHKIRFKLA